MLLKILMLAGLPQITF